MNDSVVIVELQAGMKLLKEERYKLKEQLAKLEAANVKLKGLIKEAWKAGFKASLERYAWWKAGLQYVGCGVKTLRDAFHDLEEETEGGD